MTTSLFNNSYILTIPVAPRIGVSLAHIFQVHRVLSSTEIQYQHFSPIENFIPRR